MRYDLVRHPRVRSCCCNSWTHLKGSEKALDLGDLFPNRFSRFIIHNHNILAEFQRLVGLPEEVHTTDIIGQAEAVHDE